MKILIELPTWLGDTVMATPAIDNIITYYNKHEITIIGSFVSIELIRNHPKVVASEVLNKNYISLYKISKNLGQFDVFFSFRSSFRARIFKLLVSSKKKYQFKSKKYLNCHQVEKYNRFVNHCLNTDFIAGKLKIYHNVKTSLSKSFPIVGINPGASYGEAKRWYPKEFADVANDLSKQYDIIIFGGLGEKDIADDIEKYLISYGVNNYKNLVGKTSITELITQISNLDLFITGDSGPMHIAAAFQVPTVTTFGPTNDKETSQWMNANSMIVKKSLDCQPCMKRTCPLRHHNCMVLIKAIDVMNAINSFDNKFSISLE
jgi:heptosyltransferase II